MVQNQDSNQESGSSPIKTIAMMSAASIPAHLAGAVAGTHAGAYIPDVHLPMSNAIKAAKIPFTKKLVGDFSHISGKSIGQFLGTGIAGGLADYAVLKHQKNKEKALALNQ